MSNPLQKNRSGAAILAAWLMIGYILARVGYEVYNFILLHIVNVDEYFWVPDVNYAIVLYLLPFALFTVYLLFLYRRNVHNVLMPIAFTLAALLHLLGALAYVSSLRASNMNDDHIQYRLFCLVVALTFFVAYALFAVDGFCKFRLRKVSRVMVLVLLGTTVVRCLVQLAMTLGLIGDSRWRFYPHPLVDMAMDLLFYGSLIVFFFGAAQKDDRIRLTPCHTTVSTRMVEVPATLARFCSHCGSPVQGGVCPNCGAQD